jgi:hypothetical protein
LLRDRDCEPPCDPDPRTQGYWHRQCLGVPAAEGGIDPGRNGRGPSEPIEPDFQNVLMPAVDLELQNRLFLFGGACQDGMDADPPSDKCEKAIKQYTALLLNLESGKLQNGCAVDASAEGCGSTNVGDLLNELAGLILGGDCNRAASCAGAVNEGTALESEIVTGLVVQTDPSTGTATDLTPGSASSSFRGSVPAQAEPAAETVVRSEPAAEVLVAPLVEPGMEAEPEVAKDTSDEDKLEETEHEAIQRRLAMLANASAPAHALQASRDALLTTLSGGFDPEVRLEIVSALIRQVDDSYHALLAAHLEDIRSEAMDFGKEDLAGKAERLLKQLDSMDH